MTHLPADPSAPLLPPGYRLKALELASVPGWADQDFRRVFATFLVSCRALLKDAPPPRPAQPSQAALRAVCEQALMRVPANSPTDIRLFFETYFIAWQIEPDHGEGFLTAYYEPDIEGSPVRTNEFSIPLLARPEGLVSIQPGSAGAALDPELVAARQVEQEGTTTLEALPDRASIEDGALDREGLERVWFRDRIELFMMQVQGSGRVRFEDGTSQRFTYAGRNGYPYTSIGKVIVAEGHMALEAMTLEGLKQWLRAHPVEAKRIMRLNRSFIFFAPADHIPDHLGPIGGSGVSLTPHYSIAIDRNIWPYGLPFFLETDLPRTDGTIETIARLMMGQDTGSAILGAARADYFMGSGDEAGSRAGLIRHPMRFTVLWPNPNMGQAL